MTEPTSRLGDMLRELSSAPNLREKLRVLRRSWAIVRDLSPDERERIAIALGASWTRQRLDRLLMADGVLGPGEALLSRAVDRLTDVKPGQLRRLADEIRDVDAAAVSDGLRDAPLELLGRDDTPPRAEPPLDRSSIRADVAPVSERGAAPDRSNDLPLIDGIGTGWAGRRAVSRLLTTRAIDDLDQALALVAHLDTPALQTWCLLDLIEHWPLDTDDLQRVLDAAPTDGARRRLERRHRRLATYSP